MGRTMQIAERRIPRRALLGFAALLLGALWCAQDLHADTVYLRNGSSIDGVVLGKHEGHVLLQIGNLGKMEIPQEDVLTIEKNARTGPVNPNRGDKKKDEDNPVERRESREKEKDSEKDGDVQDSEDEEIDADLEEEIIGLAEDLKRQRTAVRTRAEKKLTGLGKVVVPYVIPVTSHASELTRISSFRILKSNPDFEATEAGIRGLSDENRFVRKLAWETLQEISGESYVFPWDDSATHREREHAAERWQGWFEAEKKRVEEKKKREERRRERG